MKPVASSRDYQRISVRSGGEFRSKNSIDNPEFDKYGYKPSKEFIRNKKNLVIQEEKLKKEEIILARKKLYQSVNKLIKSMEREIFKYKK